MPSEEVTSERIENILVLLNEMGINVVEPEEAKADEKNSPKNKSAGSALPKSVAASPH
jgi:RNA polymerase primary sigma factor